MEPTLKNPGLQAEKFETWNGKTYYIQKSLSMERLAMREKLELQFSFGVSFQALFKALTDTYVLLNDRKFADAAVEIHKAIGGITNSDNQKVSAVELCKLFINAEDEDIKVYDPKVMEQKSEDWKDIDVKYFFQLAAISVQGWIQSYKELSQSFLKAEETETK